MATLRKAVRTHRQLRLLGCLKSATGPGAYDTAASLAASHRGRQPAAVSQPTRASRAIPAGARGPRRRHRESAERSLSGGREEATTPKEEAGVQSRPTSIPATPQAIAR